MTSNPERLRRFVFDFAELIDRHPGETGILRGGRRLLQELIRHDDWLPAAFAVPDPVRYGQYLLHCDSGERFSIVSFVWGPGQSTPIHDHTVWALIGVLRGAEISQPYTRTADGRLVPGAPKRLEPGRVDALSPASGDIHQVSNAYEDKVSISVHVYGGNIGGIRRSTFDSSGNAKTFISGYSNAVLPNLWDAQANQTATFELA